MDNCTHDPQIHFILSERGSVFTSSCGICGVDLSEVHREYLDKLYTWIHTGKTPRMIQKEKEENDG